MKKFFQDFKAFITKGNVLDLAVAVIIGGAFGKIVSSLVNHIIMPVISLISGGDNFSEWKTVIKAQTETTPESAIYWGMFIQNIVDFLIIAFVIFLLVRLVTKINTLAEKAKTKLITTEEVEIPLEEEKKAPEVKEPSVTQLLIDIKEILSDKKAE